MTPAEHREGEQARTILAEAGPIPLCPGCTFPEVAKGETQCPDCELPVIWVEVVPTDDKRVLARAATALLDRWDRGLDPNPADMERLRIALDSVQEGERG